MSGFSRACATWGAAIASAVGIVAILAHESCSAFGESPDTDAGASMPAVDAGGQDGGPTLADSGVAFRCPSQDTRPDDMLYCEDFEGPAAPQAEIADGGLFEIVDGFAGAGRSLHARLAAYPADVTVRVGYDHTVGDFARVAVDAEVYIAKSPDPNGADLGEFGFLNVGRGFATQTEWLVNVFVEAKQVFLTSQSPAFSPGGPATKALPHNRWMHVRLEADHQQARYRLLLAERGEALQPIVEYAAVAGKSPSPAATRTFIGIQRFNQRTPELEVFYDHVVVRTLAF